MLLLPPPEARRSLKAFILWAWGSWATRSLALGSVATVIDVSVLLVCVELFHLPNPIAAMIGVTFGSVFTFFANRHFAFRDQNPHVAPQALKFILTTAVAIPIHGALVYLLADRLRIPVVFAKLAADILVFSIGQLLVLRYIVFPTAIPKRSGSFPASGRTRSAGRRTGERPALPSLR